nr:hypothetical protein CFP56_07601 [Quercus suber]
MVRNRSKRRSIPGWWSPRKCTRMHVRMSRDLLSSPPKPSIPSSSNGTSWPGLTSSSFESERRSRGPMHDNPRLQQVTHTKAMMGSVTCRTGHPVGREREPLPIPPRRRQ